MPKPSPNGLARKTKRRSAIFDPFEIVVVPFPFTKRTSAKRRPALVVSARAFNSAQDQLVLAMITSTAQGWASDALISDWSAAGLTKPCRVRMKLFTLDPSLVQRRLGSLSAQDKATVVSAMKGVLALT